MVTILHVIPNLALAGAETMCTSLVLGLKSTGKYNVIVVSLFDYHSSLTEKMEKNGIKVIYLYKKKGIDVSMVGRLVKVMRDYKVDIVHTHRHVMQYVIPAAILANVKFRVHTVHSVAKGELGKIQRIFAYFFYKFNKVIPVAISPVVKTTVLEEYNLKSNNVPMICNGADIRNCTKKTDYQISENVRILHVGRLTDVKNQDLLIRAIKVLADRGYSNISLDLYGAGEKEAEYKELAEALSVSDFVNFKGVSDNIYPVMAEADIFVLPSKYEGMPMTLIEAMGTALPIIASRVGGIPDMIDDGKEGILIDANLDELVSALQCLIENPILRSKYGKNAYLKSKLFSSDVMVGKYSDLYEKLILNEKKI